MIPSVRSMKLLIHQYYPALVSSNFFVAPLKKEKESYIQGKDLLDERNS